MCSQQSLDTFTLSIKYKLNWAFLRLPFAYGLVIVVWNIDGLVVSGKSSRLPLLHMFLAYS